MVEGEAAGDMDLEEGPDSTHWDPGDGRAAGTGNVDGQPCRVEALGVVEEGGWYPSSLINGQSCCLTEACR